MKNTQEVEQKQVYHETPEDFIAYCNAQLKSINCAIERKSQGSPCEDGYFMEHMSKLLNFFLGAVVDTPTTYYTSRIEKVE
jgi:hypothetical protein